MKGKEIKETRSRIKEHIRGLHLSATFVRGLFGPASTKEATNKPTLPLEFVTYSENKIFTPEYYVPRRIMGVITRRATMLAEDRSRGAISPASILSESRNQPNCVHWHIFYFT